FDLGNSPREFTRERVCGKAIVMSTTNGTRALRACAGAAATLLGSWLNLEANARWIADQSPPDLLLVCSGTLDQTALEDVLAAGALCARLQGLYPDSLPADSAEIARLFYGACENDTAGVMQHSRNARRLLAMPDLRDDVAVCMQRDAVHFVAGLSGDGWIRRIGNIRVRLTN
ncbi:MAG: 2-phosphosulfolactate phosphatase, partial [Candidatus Omnitrophica bacterium]|nr:2-phosphosulfolactate phosphatase [Candidatus Omnitrophota bacterium]